MVTPKISMIGKEFGRLTVLRQIEPPSPAKDRQAWYRCACRCGKHTDIRGTSLRNGTTKSCGCLHAERTIQRNRARADQFHDLTGQRFGKLVAEAKLDERRHGQRVWRCRCDCGNIHNAAAHHLVSGAVKSCGCLIGRKPDDLAGRRFGYLTAIELTGEKKSNGGAIWRCRCDCGTYKSVPASNLIRGTAVSCGCIRRKDLVGMRFGSLTVLRLGDRSGNGSGSFWICRCNCGKERQVHASKLKSGHTRSCGCAHQDQIRDLTGQRFGRLTVLADSGQRRSGGGIIWRCQCDCGQECLIRQDALVMGRTISCGCIQSKGNAKIAQILTQAHIPFLREFSPEDMPGRCRFDFAILQDEKLSHFIEYDGILHFQFTGSGWDTEQRFRRTQSSDAQKNRYCREHGIPLLRIPYTAFPTLALQDLLLESSIYLHAGFAHSSAP